MASTDAKSGFRLPWSGDRNESDEQPVTTGAESSAVDQDSQQSESETPTMIDTAPTPSGEATQSDPAVTPEAATGPAAGRKANKFMADLTKAMQVAAESARADTLERFQNEAKAHIESIHATTAEESGQLRKRADDDIAGIREWSKNEIARIREETDERVQHRKEKLEREIEAHAAEIERRIERVQNRVAGFEAEMAYFFERLLAEEDPTRFAAMAETLPEPPPFDEDVPWTPSEVEAPVAGSTETPEAVVEPAEAPAPVVDEWGAPARTDTPSPEAGQVEEAVEPTPAEAVVETVPADIDANQRVAEIVVDGATEPVAEVGAHADTGDLFGIAADEAAPIADDPRLATLGTAPDFAAAEAEAAAFPSEAPNPEQEIPTIAEDALAARLAGLVAEDSSAPAEVASTRVVVTGLVSVASIAGFKRNLAKVAGVRSVGVSSGPDGEFVFAVNHEPGLALAEGIGKLSGFSAQITSEGPGEMTVAARDPETDR
jgi:hypothetical protein